MNVTRLLAGAVILSLALANAGCGSIGPQTIVDDRIAYNDAIANSWKQQILLNIVRIRYGDVAEFVDVSTMTNSYILQRDTSWSFGANIFPHDFASTFLAPGLSGTRTASDKPSITYAPQSSSLFTRNLITPIPPAEIFSLIEGGTSGDALLDLAVDSINGIRNRYVRGGIVHAEDPRWTKLLKAIKAAHAEESLSFRFKVMPDIDKKKAPLVAYMTIRERDHKFRKDVDPVATIRDMLDLNEKKLDFEIVFGTADPGQASEKIAVRTRSVLRVMQALSEYVEVPECHLAEGRARNIEISEEDPDPLLRVYSGCKKPCDSFAAIQYQGYWFWIDQRDDGARSKRSMAYLRTLLALADTGERAPGPLVTIRAN